MKFKVSILTPVNIGNGKKLSSYYDYIHDGKDFYLIDHRKLEEKIASFENSVEIIEQFVKVIKSRNLNDSEKYTLTHFLRDNDIEFSEVSRLKISDVKGISSEIDETMKIGDFPYIPGSSVKGAIRTAILNKFYKNGEGRRIATVDLWDKKSEKIIEKDVFGRIQEDVFKFLSCSDSDPFKKKDQTILKRQLDYLVGEKTKRLNSCEAIAKNSSSFLTIKCNATDEHGIADKFNFLKRGKELELLKEVNQFYLSVLKKEIGDHEEEDNKKKGELGKKPFLYTQLKVKLRKIQQFGKNFADDNTGTIMRIGSGKTFYDNTLTLSSSDSDMAKVKEKLKIRMDTFPKTRKIIYNGAIPVDVTGWIKLERVEEDSVAD